MSGIDLKVKSSTDASYSDETIDSLLHRIYRTNDAEAMATGRWFCQALKNFTAGGAIKLISEDDQAYRWLAQQSGLTIAADHSASGTIVVGMNPLRVFDPSQVVGETLLLFVPFAMAEQSDLNALLQRVATSHPIQGHQAVPVGGDRGVLIARCVGGS